MLEHGDALICGDINAYSPLFGANRSDTRGPGTHITPNGNCTPIDITLASPSIGCRASWRVLPNNRGSDHFRLLITLDAPALCGRQRVSNQPEENQLESLPNGLSRRRSSVQRPGRELGLRFSVYRPGLYDEFQWLQTTPEETNISLLERRLQKSSKGKKPVEKLLLKDSNRGGTR